MKKLIFAFVTVFVLGAQAQEVSIVAGMRADSADGGSAGVSADGRSGFQGGGLVKLDMMENLKLRTGLIYTQRSYDVKSGNTLLEEERLGYFEVPVGAAFILNSVAYGFGGVNAGMNISKSCGAGDCNGLNRFPLAAQVGAGFEIMKNFGVELYYEHGLTKISDEVTNPKNFVGQGTLTF